MGSTASTSFRLSVRARIIMRALAAHHGISQTGVVETALRNAYSNAGLGKRRSRRQAKEK